MKNVKEHLSDTSIDFWSWLFPVTYLMHIAEEYWGGEGYPAYLLRLRGVHLSPTRFLIAQSIGVVLVLVGIYLSRRFNFLNMYLVILGAVVLVNGLTHTFTSFLNLSYGPGLITSILIWMPLGIATLVRFKGSLSDRRYWLAVLIGLGINGVVAVFALKGGRIA
jgi:Protein of unknown function with HXXEE motif